MKKFLLNSVFVSLVLNSSLFAHDNQLAYIDQRNVQIYKAKLVQELRRTMCIQLGLLSAGVALTGFCAYKLFEPEKVVHHAKDCNQVQKLIELVGKLVEQKKLDVDTTQAMPLPNPPAEQKFEERVIESTKSLPNPPGFWKQVGEYTKYIFQSSLIMSVAGVISGATHPFLTPVFKRLGGVATKVDSLFEKVLHSVDLNWYVTTHTNLFDLFLQLEDHVDGFSKAASDSADFTYHCDGYIDSWNLLVQQMESILAFISYKIEVLAKKSMINAQRGQSISKRIQQRFDDHVPSVQKIVNDGLCVESASVLSEKMAAIKSVIHESLHSFATIELFATT